MNLEGYFVIKEELKNLDTSAKALRKFGVTIGLAVVAIAVYLEYIGSPFVVFAGGLGLLLILLGLVAPAVLKNLYFVWMALAFVMGFIMTRVILSLLFYLVMTPIGIYLRISGKDLLKLKRDGSEHSYWEKRPAQKKTAADYEKQF